MHKFRKGLAAGVAVAGLLLGSYNLQAKEHPLGVPMFMAMPTFVLISGAPFPPAFEIANTDQFIQNNTTLTTFNDTGTALGAEPPSGFRRFIILCIGAKHQSGASAYSGATIGGNACTTLKTAVHLPSTPACAAIAILEVPTGTTANVAITFTSPGMEICGFLVYRLITGPGGYTVLDDASGTGTAGVCSIPMDTARNGLTLGCSMNRNGGAWTWAGLTELNDIDVQTTENLSTAALIPSTPETNRSITATSGSGGDAWVAVGVTLAPA